MSESTSTSVAGFTPLPLPPAGLNWMTNIKRSLTLSLLSTMFASILVPMLIALFFFASQHTCRKTAVFWLNVIALVVGIVEGIYLVAIEIRSVLHPPLPEGAVILWHTLCFYTPVFVESILIFRLSAVYPSQTTPKRLRNFVVGFPIAMKIVRIIMITVLLIIWLGNTMRAGLPVDSGLLGWSLYPYPKICWGLQLLDNSFCAVAFLKRLGDRIWSTGLREAHRDRALARLRAIFFIALSNYAIPAVLSVLHLIIAILDDQWAPTTWFYICSYLMIVNNYVTIIGVVFATIWATSREWAGTHSLCTAEISCPGSATSPTSSRSGATAVGTPSPKHYRGSFLSAVSTPLSPGFPVDHYSGTGYNPSHFKFASSKAGGQRADTPLRIHVAKQSNKLYEIEVPEESELDEVKGPATPPLDVDIEAPELTKHKGSL